MYNILIVEDDPSAKFTYRKILSMDGNKVSYASNGEEGLSIAKENEFDIIITDWLMPVMDGIELISKIRSEVKKQPIIFLLTAVNSTDAQKKALFAGADEYLTKPIQFDILKEKINESIKRGRVNISNKQISKSRIVADKNFYCVGIAASTGGPSTLVKYFSSLSATKNAAFLIVLHGPGWMLKTFVKSLQEVTQMPVHEGNTGVVVKPGNIYLAQGKKHMVLKEGTNILEQIDAPAENYVKPSADPLFRSIANSFGSKSIGMVFTGMGKDGALGCGYIHAAGGRVMVQDPKTAILPSMPEAVINLKMANQVIPLDNMAAELHNCLAL